MSFSQRKGFTLIELLVVIAIIAILAAILFPVFTKAREKARMTQCTSNQRQIATAVLSYSQDHSETYPNADSMWSDINISELPGTAPTIAAQTSFTGTKVCPDRTDLAIGYIYNYRLSGRALGDPNLIPTVMQHATPPATATEIYMTADGYHTGTLNPPTLHNVGFLLTDFSCIRHNLGTKLLASFLDGHVDVADTSIVYNIPLAQPGNPVGTPGALAWSPTTLPTPGSSQPINPDGTIELVTDLGLGNWSVQRLGNPNPLESGEVVGLPTFGTTALAANLTFTKPADYPATGGWTYTVTDTVGTTAVSWTVHY